MKNFEFPLPPSGLLVTDAPSAKRWPCEVLGWGANSIQGRLLTFDVAQQLIKVQATAAKSATAIRFNQFKCMRVDGGLRMLGAAPSPEDALDAVLNFQPYMIRLIDGSRLTGQSAGVQDLPSGLWMFVKDPTGSGVARLFVPRSALESYEAADVATNGVDADSFSSTDFASTLMPVFAETTLDFHSGMANGVIETRADLLTALERQARIKPVPIGEALIGLGKITAVQLGVALKKQKETKNVPLGQILVELGMVSTADLQMAFARKMGYPLVELKSFEYDVDALRLVPLAMALRLKVQPLMLNKGLLVVAMADPLQFKILEEMEFTTQLKVMPVLCSGDEIASKISRIYREVGLAEQMQEPRDAQTPQPDVSNLAQNDVYQLASELVVDSKDTEEERQIEQSDNTLVRLINSMIFEAFQQGASDIHIEPYPGRQKLKIRFRIDGRMRPYLELPASYRNALIARIKIMCDLDISEKRKAQDGKINFSKFGGLKLELRVATIPTTQGLEDVVMRILASSRSMALADIGLSARNLALFTQAIDRPYGMVLCVGPTGSGKTTTLHSALHHLNQPDRKIWTAEDPVEITQHGLRQIQVNSKIGWTFATALRSLLRADPDVIMVGEIRDQETAEIAVEASLTGHLVMSTLHTNSAAETITRLIDLGLDPFSFSDSVLAVMAQRLVRRLCPHCVKRVPMGKDELEQLTLDYQIALPPDDTLRDPAALHAQWRQAFGQGGVLHSCHAPGCEKCGQTGFRGRLGIHELLVVTPELRHLIQIRARSEDVLNRALTDGMRTLRQDGIEKVLLGHTSLSEVRANSNA
ncbi:GspE/PulE family protein [Hydrogenophaga sp. OTU3427]|uniref:GspE/PulE family protein n=1 Tax=Hydrogenophaga sp. OTU3427 TaxID=3043856 RepID=UPI00313E5F80